MDSPICKYSQKYSLIDSCQTHKTPTSTTNIQTFFWQRGCWRARLIGGFWWLQVKSILCISVIKKRSGFPNIIWTIWVNLLVLPWVLIFLSNRFSQLKSTSKRILNFWWLSLTFSFPSMSNIVIQNSILPVDVLNCTCEKYQFSFVWNFGNCRCRYSQHHTSYFLFYWTVI